MKPLSQQAIEFRMAMAQPIGTTDERVHELQHGLIKEEWEEEEISDTYAEQDARTLKEYGF